MSTRFVALFGPKSTPHGDPGHGGISLRSFRLACICGAVLTPLLGALLDASGPVVDPWSVRWAATAYVLVVFGLTYTSAAVRRHVGNLHQSGVYFMTLYSGALVYANSLSATYALGYLLGFMVLALSYGLAYRHPEPFKWFLGFSMAIAIIVSCVTPRPDEWRLLFGGGSVAMAALMYVSVGARMEMYSALRSSQSVLSAAERLAGAGSWEVRLAEGARVWSEGMYRLLGVPQGSVPPDLVDLVHPDDRAEVDAVVQRLLSEAVTIHHTFRVVTAGDDVRILASISESKTGPSGKVEQGHGVLMDVTEQVQRENALREARDQAEAGARAKSSFLANMSHEIRTPLTAILGYAQILAEETGPEHQDLVGPIESGSLRLLATLNSVLDLARMDADNTNLAVSDVDAAAEVESVVEMLSAQASGKGISLHAEVQARPVLVRANRDAFSRVLANLVSNAVKFTQDGGVVVSARYREDGEGEIAVVDSGSGMSEEFLTHLYEPFQQASTGWGRSHEGTGLGLTITRRLVEEMGGRIEVESALGQGSRFVVVLPVCDALPVSSSLASSATVNA